MDDPNLEQLVADVSLEGITFFEVSAVRASSAEPPEDEEIAPSFSVNTASRDDDKGFRVRIRTEIDVSLGPIVVDVSADYELDQLFARGIGQPVIQDFVNGVAVMVLVPYIRQAVADITLRVFGSALKMPMVRRGEMEFELVPAKAATED